MPQNHRIVGIVLAVTVLAAALESNIACSREDQVDITLKVAMEQPGMATRPTAPGDLRPFTTPPERLGEAVLSPPSPLRPPDGPVAKGAGPIATFKLPDGKSVKLAWQSVPGWQRQKALDGALSPLAAYLDAPLDYLKGFESDFAFFEAVHRTVPTDLAGARSDAEGNATRARLLLKSKQPLPVTLISSTRARSFLGRRGESWVADVFDQRGRYRGYLTVNADVSDNALEEAVKRILAGLDVAAPQEVN